MSNFFVFVYAIKTQEWIINERDYYYYFTKGFYAKNVELVYNLANLHLVILTLKNLLFN